MKNPFAVKEDKNYIVLYKPGNMHSAPLKESEEGTLLHFCVSLFPEVSLPQGKKKIEGGLVHRLDYETQGLVLFARNQKALDYFFKEQDEGRFLKRYEAIVSKQNMMLDGFPPPPEWEEAPFEIKSMFRAYGPGRKAVRPVHIDTISKHKDDARNNDALYVTNILSWEPCGDNTIKVNVQLCRGFRHQIRASLAWLGFPILNDQLYGGQESSEKGLALKAVSLSFIDPETEKPVEINM